MKKSILRQLIVLPLLTVVMAGLYACGSASGTSRAASSAQQQPFNTTYVLAQGDSAMIAPAAQPAASGKSGTLVAPVVRLDRVNDSRCREGAVCVWAGYISYSLSLTRPNGATSNFVLSDSMPNGATSVTQDGLTFTLVGVEPQTVPPKNDIIPDYRVSIRVSNVAVAPQPKPA
ncbi:hypothetical protein ASF04_01755 [Duganella sp. Leaf61]|uniref:hypothetical protein n=1 Tax=Duganella sp. Leaf61 TaxID=1736227 RepID=UPI0006F9292A|nr:hypothetical protein [Duganella sp. Leaf61]KQN79242.1 hypothetical protein ASF04_01755 [Duganella sp. Leaf61]